MDYLFIFYKKIKYNSFYNVASTMINAQMKKRNLKYGKTHPNLKSHPQKSKHVKKPMENKLEQEKNQQYQVNTVITTQKLQTSIIFVTNFPRYNLSLCLIKHLPK